MLVNLWQRTLECIRESFPQGAPGRKSRRRTHATNSQVEALECRVVPATVNITAMPPETTSSSSVIYQASFSESVSGVDASDFRVTVNGSVIGVPVVNVASEIDTFYIIEVSGLSGNGDVRLDLIDDDSIISGTVELGGPGLGNGSFQGPTYRLIQSAPAVMSINRLSPVGQNTTDSTVSYLVTFNRPVTGVDPSDFALARTGTVNAVTPVVVTGSDTTYTVTIDGITGSGTLGLNLVDNNTIHDLNGNPLFSPTGAAAFSTPISVSSGTTLQSIVLEDVNGDSNLDLIGVNISGNNVQVSLGNGAGGFQSPQTFGTGQAPVSVTVRDVNGDGLPDIITANRLANSVSVLLGNGNGTFQAQQTFAVGQLPRAVTIEDLNADGRPELIVTNQGSDTVSVLQGMGDGTFAPHVQFATGLQPSDVAVRDLDNDGLIDIVVANQGSDNVSILIAMSGLAYQPQVTFTVGSGPAALIVVDLGRDGRYDIITANKGSNNVSILSQYEGVYQFSFEYPTGLGPTDVQAGDINGDGEYDLIVANQGQDSVSVLLGSSGTSFFSTFSFNTGGGPNSVASGDINGDGRLDVMTSNITSNSITALGNTVRGHFEGELYNHLDGTPFITSSSTAYVPENYPITDVVLDVEAIDSDLPAQTLTYSLSGIDAARFPIDSATGEIRFLVSPDFELPADANGDNNYQLRVTVADGTGAIGTQDITVFVTPSQDNTPFFSSPDAASVDENTPSTNVVLDVDATSADLPAYSYEYYIIGTDAELFSIDNITGEIRFRFSPDYEFPEDANSDNVYEFTVSVYLGSEDSIEQSVSITVMPVNDIEPSLGDDPDPFTNENVAATTVIYDANAYDGDLPLPQQTLTYGLSGIDAALFNIDSATGEIRFNASPDYEIPADADADNIYELLLTVTDDGVPPLSRTRTLFVTVYDINDAPVANSATISLLEDGSHSGFLSVSDQDSAAITFTIADQPLHGTVVITDPTTGAYTYTPDVNYFGSDSFTFSAADGMADSNIGITTITVVAVNDAPSFSPGLDQFVYEDEPGDQVSAGWATEATPGAANEGSQSLNYVVTNSNNSLFSVQPYIEPNGTLHYTLAPNAFGDANLTVVLVDDGGTGNGGQNSSAPQSFNIVVYSVNDAPTLVPGGDITVLEDSGTYNAIWATDISPGPNESGEELIFSVSTDYPALFSTQPTIAPDGTLTFTTAANAFGTTTVTVVLMTYSESPGPATEVTFTITVQAVNDPPQVASAAIVVDEDGQIIDTIQVTDVDSAAFTYSVVSDPSHGTLVLNSITGEYTYTPDPDYHGEDSFAVKANDGVDDSNVAAITIEVSSVNDEPVASDATFSATEDSLISGTLTATDDSPSIQYFIVDAPVHGTLVLDDFTTGAFTYTPDANYNGPDTFTFRATDDALNSNLATVTINVAPVNDAPIAEDGVLEVAEDLATTGTLMGTDVDVSPLTFTVATAPAHGTVIITNSATGEYTYTPDADYSGSDTFKFLVNDGTVDSNTATISVNVSPVNDSPVATDSTETGIEESPVTGSMLATDVDSLALTFYLITAPAHGTLLITNVNTGAYTYTPDPGYNGVDTFQFVANDGTLDSDTATVTITVTPLNSPPIGVDSVVGVLENSLPGTVVGFVTAIDDIGDTLSFSLISGNTSGTFALDSATGAITVVSNALLDFENPVTFNLVVTITDAGGLTGTANTTVNILNVDEPLVVTLPNPSSTFYRGGQPQVLSPAAFAADPDTEITTYNNGRLQVSIDSGAHPDDRLYVQTQGNGPGKISVLYGNVVYESSLVIIGRIVSGETGGPLIIELTSFATPIAVDTLLRSITFHNANPNLPAGKRLITVDLSNASGSEHDTETKSIDVIPTSVPPVVTLPSGDLDYQNRSTAIAIDAGAIVTDVDSPDFDGGRLSVSIAQGLSRKDRLKILGTGGISISRKEVFFNGSRIGLLTQGKQSITVDFDTIHATPAAVQALIRNVAFSTKGRHAASTDRLINITVADGTGAVKTASKLVRIV